ncbi:MAG: hypothetical protein JO360_04615 [Acidobacteria bacterium]|nr:hypothetical protein [Acidobacteriota bacterium]
MRWRDLTEETRRALARKLEGLYGQECEAAAFDCLAEDKREALLILLRRLSELGLWDAVRRIDNVYGIGGVGMSFTSWPLLASSLRGRRDFTTLFANHSDNAGGFLERGKLLASLHFLHTDSNALKWGVHFDLYNPWASPLNAWRHLLHEKLRGETPDWKSIRKAL